MSRCGRRRRAATPAWSEPLRVEAGFLADGEWVAEPIGLADPAREAQPALRAHDVRRSRSPSPRDPVLDRTRRRRARAQRRRRVGRRPLPRLDELPRPARARDASMSPRSGARRRERARARRSPAPGTPRSTASSTSRIAVYGDQPSFLGQLRVEFADGTAETLAATGRRVAGLGNGPVVDSGIYAGEHQDLRRADRRLVDAAASTTPAGRRCASEPRRSPATRTSRCPRRASPPPVRRIQTPSRRRGARHRPPAPACSTSARTSSAACGCACGATAGQRITIRHAEVLDDGELGTPAAAERGSRRRLRPRRRRREILESRFSFYGFRYAADRRLAGDFDPAAVEAVVLHTDMTRTGWFDVIATRCSTACTRTSCGACAATSCPSRPTAPSATSASAGPATCRSSRPTASFLYDCDGFLTSWLRDLALEQARNDGERHPRRARRAPGVRRTGPGGRVGRCRDRDPDGAA